MINLKNSKFILVLMIFLLSFLLISTVNASNTDDNADLEKNIKESVTVNEISEPTSNNYQITEKQIKTESKDKSNTNNTNNSNNNNQEKINDDDDEISNDCATTVMQVSENESLLSFRRDSTGSTINVYIENNSSFIKQYKTVHGYFFHVLVNKDGWMVGTGGDDGVAANKKIESRALSMIKNNRISMDDLNYVASIHRSFTVGHFLIKAPNGTYGFEIYSRGSSIKKLGTLQNGQYIVCPNSRALYHIGNYKTYTKTDDVVKASRLLALKDSYGINRRNIMTYHYRNNIVNSTIDFYVANDDGSYVGRKTGYLSDNIKTNTKTVSAKSIPKGSKGLYVQSYTFKFNPKVNFSVTTNKNLTKMGQTITLTAKLYVNNKAYDKGYVIFKINGITIKDAKNQNIKAYLKNATASINYTIPDGWSAKSVKVTAVYSKNLFGRLENKTYFALERSNISMQLNNIVASSRQIVITGKLLDENNHKVKGKNVFSIKINGLTLKKENNQTRYFEVHDGIINITFTLPSNYKLTPYDLTLATGTRAAYNANRQTTKLTFN